MTPEAEAVIAEFREGRSDTDPFDAIGTLAAEVTVQAARITELEAEAVAQSATVKYWIDRARKAEES